MHQPPTQKFLPLFSRTCVSNPLRTSPHHAWHPVSLPLQEKPIALWAPNALEPPVPDDFSEHILWTCLTTWDIQKPAKVSIHSLPKTTLWNNLGEYKHQHQVPIIRYCPCSNMLVNLFPAVQLLPHRLLGLPHRNQLLLLQQEKLTVSQYFALHIDGIGHYLCKLVAAFASVKSPKGVPEQATEPWWIPQPGPHSTAAYTMVHAHLLFRCCSSSRMLVNRVPAVQLLLYRLLGLSHRNQPLLLQQVKPADSQISALHIDGIGHYLCKLIPAFASIKNPKGIPEQATEPWWKPQPGPHSNAAYTMVHAPLLCYGTNASKSQVSPKRGCYTGASQNLKASCSRSIPKPKASTPVWTKFHGSPIHEINSRPLSSNSGTCFGISRRLKNWSPASADTQLSSLSQGNRNTLSSQYHLTTTLPTHPRQPPPPQLRHEKCVTHPPHVPPSPIFQL